MKRLIGLFLVILSFGITTYSQRPTVAVRPLPITTELKNTTNETADSSYTVFYMGDYSYFAIEQIATGGINVKYFMSLRESASDTDTTDWVNAGEYFFGTDSLKKLNPRIIKYSDESFNPTKIMIYNDNLDDANSNLIIVRKW